MQVCLNWGTSVVHAGFVFGGLLAVFRVWAPIKSIVLSHSGIYCPEILFFLSLSLSPNTQLTKNFNTKLEEYFQMVGEVSQFKKQDAHRQPATHSHVGLVGGGDDHSPSWSVSSSSDSSDNAMY